VPQLLQSIHFCYDGQDIFSAGYSLTYFTIDSVFPLVVFSIGGCHGIGFIFVYAVAIGTVQKWFPDNIKGLMGSIVVSGYGFGSLVWIPAETTFVNPENIKPAAPACLANTSQQVECEQISDKYFTDPVLLERVPYSFLVLGAVIGAMSIVGIILTKEPPLELQKEKKKTTTMSLRPAEVIRTRVFYLIWLGFFAVNFSQGILVNWQKTFGLKLVTSDHFHSNIGIITSFFAMVLRVIL